MTTSNNEMNDNDAKQAGPLVTVVMPVYNVRDYIEEAISSVLAQSFSDFELLVIDDESPDDSIEFVKSQFSDSRIKIVHQQKWYLQVACHQ